MTVFFILLLLLLSSGYIFLHSKKFGKIAKGNEKSRLSQSPFFQSGKFMNIAPTPDLSEDASYSSIIYEQLFAKDKRVSPKQIIPTIKTNLKTLPLEENCIVWMGHSSYYFQIDGRKFLVDPVFGKRASPIPGTVNAFLGTNIYTVEDLPIIDYLIITHDHWDHLDYATVKNLMPKSNKIITGIGTDIHLKYWGCSDEKIFALDWNQDVELENGFTLFCKTARHFSGRQLKRQQSIWISAMLISPNFKIYIGGDSGYGNHFKKIGDEFGTIDLAILECGQYNKSWKYIHMFPEETVQAAIDLKAKRLLPVHWGKFSLATHAWDDSINRVWNEAKQKSLPLITPMIGEKIIIDKIDNWGSEWWRNIE